MTGVGPSDAAPDEEEKQMRRKQRHLLASVTAIAGLTAFIGCSDRELRPLNPCTVQGVAETVKVDNIEEIDLLFMVDNSNSMAQEQNALSRELPNLVRVLASGDIEGDGMQEFPPVRSLQVGVVTSDMGTGGFMVPTCSNSRFGDDGVLRTRGNTARAGCVASYPSFFEFRPADGGSATDFANEVNCVAGMGTNGCGFEQQLESVLKAVTPSSSGIRFVEGSVGHADGQNAGFVRPNSLLTIILVTDEEDCSAANPEVFDPASTTFGGDLNLRCWTYGNPADGIIHPVERFVDGLLATRAAAPDLLVVAAITGIPDTTNPVPGADIDFAGILAHPDMVEQVDPMMPSRLRPSCDRTDEAGERSIAFPPRRIVSMLQQLDQRGANAILQTICQDSFAGALEAVILKLADILGGTCLPRALVRGQGNIVNCDVVEQLPPGQSCSMISGRSLDRMETDPVTGMSVEVCEVNQLGVDNANNVEDGDGWYYDDFSDDVRERCGSRPQRITFRTPPITGTTVRLECLQTLGAIGGGVGTECGAEGCPSGLACDSTTNTCQPSCTTNADCAGGFVCYTAPEATQAFCVNPTCDN